MIKFLLTIAVVLSLNPAFAQKQFQGIVKYKVAHVNETDITEMSAYFKGNFIRFSTSHDNIDKNIEEEAVILDIEKRICYEINKKDKILLTDSIKNDTLFSKKIFENNSTDSSKEILGHKCHSATLKNFNNISEMTFFYATDLLFTIPDVSKFYEGLPFYSNGINLGLGLSMKIPDADSIISFDCWATEINETILPDSIFTLPKDYTIIDEKKYLKDIIKGFSETDKSLELIETEMTEIKEDPPPPPPPPLKAKKNKPKMVVKSKSSSKK